MKRLATLLILLIVTIALVVSPTMSGGVGPSGFTLLCDSPSSYLDAPVCAPLSTLFIVAGLMLGAVLVLTMLLLLRWFRARQKGLTHDGCDER